MLTFSFLPVEPWPEEANGQGPTLELIAPDRDNVLAKNWHAFEGIGTPGAKNHILPLDSLDANATLILYPNPLIEELTLELAEEGVYFESIALYAYDGKLIERKEIHEDSQREKFNAAVLERGLYLIVTKLSDERFVSKVFEKY